MEEKLYEIKCILPEEEEEGLLAHLLSLGTVGTWSTIIVNSNRIEVYAYFSLPKGIKQIFTSLTYALSRSSNCFGKFELSHKPVLNTNWLSEWKKHYKPVRIGKNLLIVPSWHTVLPKEKTIIKIDPGMAFGTGTHPTTRLCLIALEEIISSNPKKSFSVIDIGCGSGILAIAAKKIGVKKVAAIDVDSEALKNMEKNCTINNVSIPISTHLPKGKTFHITLCNILPKTHIALKNDIASSVKENGWLILSGILQTKAQLVLNTFLPLGFSLIKKRRKKEWVSLMLRKSSLKLNKIGEGN